MAIFQCKMCNHIQEASNEHTGKRAKCPKCQKDDIIHNTIDYIKELTETCSLQNQKIQKLEQETQDTKQSKSSSNIIEVYDPLHNDNFDIHNTDLFSQHHQYDPIIKWFKKRGIKANIDPKMMDTTGFFDEIAIYIGDNFNVLGPVVNQIKYIQSKKFDTVKISLSKKNNKEAQQIISFCKTLYDYSFIAKFYHQKKDKSIYLTLHNVTRIKRFFNGLWMEWFVLIKLITLFKEYKITPALARGINITFSNNNSNELDIFFINKDNEPVCIECKTGEFRQDLSKYLSLQKKLNIKKENFILCVFGLSGEQVQGLTSMYEFTMANESTLVEHIKNIL